MELKCNLNMESSINVIDTLINFDIWENLMPFDLKH